MNPLLQLAIGQMPSLIQMIKDAHAQANPTLPPLTDGEVIAIWQQAVASSEAKDDSWIAVHGA